MKVPSDFGRCFLLPPPADGWFPLGFSVDGDGILARLSASIDLRNLRSLASPAQVKKDDSVPGRFRCRARIDFPAASAVASGPEFDLEGALSLGFDRLPDGRWIVAERRCAVGEDNARLFSTEGRLLSRFSLGDGIQHLQCDADSGIWVGYFDEGVYGNLGWGGNGPAPLGDTGLNRFDATGALLWTASALSPGIDDCYALNVAGEAVWACYYSDFPIVRIGADGSFRLWENDIIRGAKAVAVDGDTIVLFGGYGDRSHRVALLKLGERQAELIREFDLAHPSVSAVRSTFGRGAKIHLVTEATWVSFSVSDVLAITAKP